MKMKKTFNILLTVILMMTVSLSATAQDGRQRTTETIVQDVLALVPVQNQADYNREMESLAKSAPQSIVMLAKMLQPAEKHANNKIEYAIHGATAFASTNQALRNAVAEGLRTGMQSAPDATTKQFLAMELRLLSSQNDVTYPAVGEGAATYTAAYDKLKAAGQNAGAEVVKTLKTKDHALRMQALKFATDYNLTDAALVKQIAGKYGSCNEEGKVDIINWLGDNKVESQKPLLIKAIKKGGAPAKAAIEALGRIGGEDACDAILGQLGTDNGAAAISALASYTGKDLGHKVNEALASATSPKLEDLLTVAKLCHIKATYDKVLAQAQSGNQAAIEALPAVVSAKEAPYLTDMLGKCDAAQTALYQTAAAAALKQLSAADQYKTVSAVLKGASQKDRLYPMLAATNTDEAVAELQAAGSKAALNALKKSTNYKAAAPLLKAAKDGDESALLSYVKLVNANEKNLDSKYSKLAEALSLAKGDAARKNIITSLGATPTRNAFILVGKQLDDAKVSYEAAAAAKAIINKTTEDIENDLVTKNLNKAIDIYKAHGTADDGYAVDELKLKLNELKPSPIYVLTDEEKKAGYELLFDGTNLDNFVGNKVGYVPINGCINVTANYGNESNLYTQKEYRNFIFRFEFCFLRPGVNNGVGIRTPMGVDAAYDGMCECQILDHDDPIYAGLREYQVHGSVYGVIPAKRIKHKPLGEWSYEEIRVEGNHITVTVNGEVIVDGDIKEACQGHNVAPDGSDKNPYTVDHRNHPGMFNKTGHIGFLGHGAGLKFRNVRVLDLDAHPQGKKGSKKK